MTVKAAQAIGRERAWRRLGTDAPVAIFLVALGLVLPSLVGVGRMPMLITALFALYLAYSWNIVGGILGELSLVHMIFWGAGGYALVLAFNHRHSWLVWVAVAIVAAAALGVTTVRLATSLKLVGLYLAVFTLIVHELAVSAVGEIEHLGKDVGLYLTTSAFWSQEKSYYVLFGLVVFVVAVNAAVLLRPVGLRWLMLRDDPVAAQSIGINPTSEKSAAYALSAVLAVIGGAFHAYYLGYVQPELTISMTALIAAILAVFVGGPGTLWGPFTGVVVVFGLGQLAATYSTSAKIALYAQLLQYVASFLVIYFVTSRLQSGDLLTHLLRRVAAGVRWVARAGRGRADAPATDPRRLAVVPPAGPTASDGAARPGPAEDAQTVLSVDDVHKDFGGLVVLTGISCELKAGSITALVGPNGAGKTTLCNIISGFERASAGSVALDGRDISALRPHARFRAGVGRTFQTPRLCDRLSLEQNVAAATRGNLAAARTMLARVGVAEGERLAGASDLYQRRLAEVARAVAGAQRIVLLDEPLVGLAHDQQQAILGLLRELAEAGLAILIVEHLIPVVAPAADRMIVLVNGKLIADGTPAVALAQPDVIEAYLGEPIELTA
jgi:branched-chain amino acid transport system permease protein